MRGGYEIPGTRRGRESISLQRRITQTRSILTDLKGLASDWRALPTGAEHPGQRADLGAGPGPRDRVGFFSLAAGYAGARTHRGGAQAHPPNGNRGCVCRRARRCAGFGRPGSILSALFAVSAVLAVLRCGRCRRRRRDDRNRAILGIHRNAALLLWLLWTALFPSSGL